MLKRILKRKIKDCLTGSLDNRGEGKVKEQKELKESKQSIGSRISINQIICILLILALVYLSTGGIWEEKNALANKHLQEVEETLETDIKSIEMNLQDIDVEVHLVESDTVEVIEYASNDEDEELVEMKQDAGKVVIQSKESKHRGFWKWLKWGNTNKRKIEVNIPNKFKEQLQIVTLSGDIKIEENWTLAGLELFTASGDIHLGEIKADSEIESASGDIYINALLGKEHQLKTASGEISLEKGEGNFEIASISGDQRLGIIMGKSHEISSTSGSIDIEEIEGTCDMTSVSGAFNVEHLSGDGKAKLTSGEFCVEELDLQGDLKVETLSGEVELTFTSDSNAAIELKSKSGGIKGDMPISYAGINKTNGVAEIGNGTSNHVEIETVSGDIYIE